MDSYDGRESDEQKRRLDRELDLELEATFPASDALKITRPGHRTEPEPELEPADEQGSRRKK